MMLTYSLISSLLRWLMSWTTSVQYWQVVHVMLFPRSLETMWLTLNLTQTLAFRFPRFLCSRQQSCICLHLLRPHHLMATIVRSQEIYRYCNIWLLLFSYISAKNCTQANAFTVRDGSNVLINDDLAYLQRSSGGRNLPVTTNGLLKVGSATCIEIAESF